MGEQSQIEYDSNGFVSATIDAVGNRSETDNDILGHPREIRKILTAKTLTTVLHYDDAGHLQLIIDPRNHLTSFENDLKGRVTAVTDALLNRTEYLYSGKGQLIETTQVAPGADRSFDAVTRMEYDSLGRLERTTDPEGNATSFTGRGSGRVWGRTKLIN